MEDILSPMRDRTGKMTFVLSVISAFIAVAFFIALQNVRANGGGIAVPLWGGVICTILALLFGIITFVRFLRRRSITTGLFVTTAVATVVYSIATRVVRVGGVGTAYSPVTALAAGTATTAANTGFFTAATFVQIGLFAVWFLFLLFTIYIYIRPIRRIDHLLTQILEGGEIRKLRVGKSVQYKSIQDKLQTLADEKYNHTVKRTARLNKSRAARAHQRELMRELLTEQDKLSPTPAEE